MHVFEFGLITLRRVDFRDNEELHFPDETDNYFPRLTHSFTSYPPEKYSCQANTLYEKPIRHSRRGRSRDNRVHAHGSLLGGATFPPIKHAFLAVSNTPETQPGTY